MSKDVAKMIVIGMATAQGATAAAIAAALVAIDAHYPDPAVVAGGAILHHFADGGVVEITIAGNGARNATVLTHSPLADAADLAAM